MTREIDDGRFDWLFSKDGKMGTIRQTKPEANLLWKYANKTKSNIVEVGRLHGGSTSLMVDALSRRKEGSTMRIHSIDLTTNLHHPKSMKLFSRNSDRLNLITADSRYIRVTEHHDLLFIDGDHTYEGVRADTLNHWPGLCVGGFAIFHDTDDHRYPGIIRFFNEWNEGERIERADTMMVVQKTKSEN